MKTVKRYRLKNTINWNEFIVFEGTLHFYTNMKNIEVVWEEKEVPVSNYSWAISSSKTESLVLGDKAKKEAEKLVSKKEEKEVKTKKETKSKSKTTKKNY